LETGKPDPEGCVKQVITEEVTAYVKIQGLIDVNTEVNYELLISENEIKKEASRTTKIN
jgi:hypothetical protein